MRGGVTLTEVLISIGILSVGLLGAAAMFPVGGYFMQKGEIADRGAAIAQAAFADLVARGDLDPSNWGVWNGGAYNPMDKHMRDWMGSYTDDSVDFQSNMNSAVGFVYVIDPLGTAAGFRQGVNPARLSRAPIDADPTDPTDAAGFTPSVIPGNATRWNSFSQWPVRRLCTRSMVMGNSSPSEPMARNLYSSSDDLSIVVVDDDESQPRRQRMVGVDTNNDKVVDVPFRRESQGNFSWMAMVTPTQSEARQALALDPSAFYFDVSVVVFYKRPVNNIETSERLVHGTVVSTGTGGGEILLTKLQNDPGDPFEELKQGQWVMVTGPHPSSTRAQPLFFAQWYRVLAIDEQLRSPITDTDKQRLVGLRGPDWPWKTAGTQVRVGLFPGAVAVHTKTMRLNASGAYEL